MKNKILLEQNQNLIEKS